MKYEIRPGMLIATILTGIIAVAAPPFNLSGDSEVATAIYGLCLLASFCFSCLVSARRWWIWPLLVVFCEFIIPACIGMVYHVYFK